jgi:hypothetical protein
MCAGGDIEYFSTANRCDPRDPLNFIVPAILGGCEGENANVSRRQPLNFSGPQVKQVKSLKSRDFLPYKASRILDTTPGYLMLPLALPSSSKAVRTGTNRNLCAPSDRHAQPTMRQRNFGVNPPPHVQLRRPSL